jgi:cytochrome c553
MKKMVFILALCTNLLAHAAANLLVGQEKSTVCAACHGTKGVSINPQWPSLAGQHAGYLIKQLLDFKRPTRPSAVMTPLVANLTEQDMQDIAAFYNNQTLPEGSTPKKYLSRGEQLYRGGDFNLHITACIACHGPKGTGNSEAGFPVLSGQQPLYTIQQLQAFKDNKRSNDLNSIMRDISYRMRAEDMEAVAYYISGLH